MRCSAVTATARAQCAVPCRAADRPASERRCWRVKWRECSADNTPPPAAAAADGRVSEARVAFQRPVSHTTKPRRDRVLINEHQPAACRQIHWHAHRIPPPARSLGRSACLSLCLLRDQFTYVNVFTRYHIPAALHFSCNRYTAATYRKFLRTSTIPTTLSSDLHTQQTADVQTTVYYVAIYAITSSVPWQYQYYYYTTCIRIRDIVTTYHGIVTETQR